MRSLFLVLVLLLCTSPALAQTNPVPVGQPFTLAFDHDGQNVLGFRCLVDGKPASADLPASGRSCAIPSQAAGAHTLTVLAFNAFGSATSPPLTATAGSPPTGPNNLRITVQIAVQPDGNVTLLASAVTRDP